MYLRQVSAVIVLKLCKLEKKLTNSYLNVAFIVLQPYVSYEI